ncbi:17049_t:CDS:2, partial [Racocetra fulgida]
SGDDLIRHILERWAENTNAQEISNIITAVMNVAQKLCSVVDFIRDKIDQLKGLLLDQLPFSIFPKLLQLFKPLEHVKIVTMRNIRDMLVAAFKLLDEIPPWIWTIYYLEHLAFKSFLEFLIYSYLNLYQKVGMFLDPNAKPIFIDDEAVKRLVLDECQDYYSKIDNSFGNNSNEAIQYLANDELERYKNLPAIFFSENDDLCKWWQNSKSRFPGLATLAIKYLPLLGLDNDLPLENLDKFIEVYDD